MFTLEIPARLLGQTMRSASEVCRKNSIPVLTHALIKAEGARVSICTTDLDRWVTTEIEGEGSGEVTIHAEHLERIAQSLDGGSPLKISVNGSGMAEVSQGRAHFELPTLPATDFPSAPERKTLYSWPLDAKALSDKLKAIEPAIERGKRQYLKGVFFDLRAGAMVTTDGHKLGVAPIDGLRVEDRDVPSFTIPYEAVPVILGLCKSGDLAMSLHDGASTAQFVSGKTTFRTKLMGEDQRFPDYAPLVPKSGKVCGTVHPANFLRALSCASNVTPDNAGTLKIEVFFDKGELVLTAKDGEGRKAVDVCEWDRERGQNMTAGFNSPYLAWAMSSLGDAKILRLEIDDMASALVVRAADDATRAELRLVMPRA